MLQCVIVRCSVSQCVAAWCSALQCVAASCSVFQYAIRDRNQKDGLPLLSVPMRCSQLQCVAVCYCVLQCVAVCCSALQCVAVCCSVLQCVAVCCSALQSGAGKSKTGSLPSLLVFLLSVYTEICIRKTGAKKGSRRLCNALQFIATHSNTLHRTASHCNTLQHTATHCNTLQHTATHCRAASPPPLGTKRSYGVATISRLLKIIGLFCKRALQKRRYCAKETYNLKEATNRSHPIPQTATHSNTHGNTYRNTHCDTHCNTLCKTLQLTEE